MNNRDAVVEAQGLQFQTRPEFNWTSPRLGEHVLLLRVAKEDAAPGFFTFNVWSPDLFVQQAAATLPRNDIPQALAKGLELRFRLDVDLRCRLSLASQEVRDTLILSLTLFPGSPDEYQPMAPTLRYRLPPRGIAPNILVGVRLE